MITSTCVRARRPSCRAAQKAQPANDCRLNVFLTVDVETWPCTPDWRSQNLTQDIERDIRGVTDEGEFGIPFQIAVLNGCGLKAAFFVESLFASVVGVRPLRGIVDLIQRRAQEVQLHAHPEWLRYMAAPPVPDRCSEYFKDYSLSEQTALVGEALRNLRAAGAGPLRAFRAGNYGANFDTLRAVARNGLLFETSHNHCYRRLGCAMPTPGPFLQPRKLFGAYEFPITYFRDWPGHCRHLQLCACSSEELEAMLVQAWRQGWYAVVLVSHCFELLKHRKDPRRRQTPDWIVIRRFERLCRFLAAHDDQFVTRGFNELDETAVPYREEVSPLRSSLRNTGGRLLEQLARRVS
jgi:hypothetical protein